MLSLERQGSALDITAGGEKNNRNGEKHAAGEHAAIAWQEAKGQVGFCLPAEKKLLRADRYGSMSCAQPKSVHLGGEGAQAQAARRQP